MSSFYIKSSLRENYLYIFHFYQIKMKLIKMKVLFKTLIKRLLIRLKNDILCRIYYNSLK